jgi:NAD(P)-dependent dehydrogenase (short-subunit alcohol dehydrogenase family)
MRGGTTGGEGHPSQRHLAGTHSYRDFWQGRNLDAAQAGISAVLQRWQPLPYVGMTEDIAQAALFLASDASRLINGHNLVVVGAKASAG